MLMNFIVPENFIPRKNEAGKNVIETYLMKYNRTSIFRNSFNRFSQRYFRFNFDSQVLEYQDNHAAHFVNFQTKFKDIESIESLTCMNDFPFGCPHSLIFKFHDKILKVFSGDKKLLNQILDKFEKYQTLNIITPDKTLKSENQKNLVKDIKEESKISENKVNIDENKSNISSNIKKFQFKARFNEIKIKRFKDNLNLNIDMNMNMLENQDNSILPCKIDVTPLNRNKILQMPIKVNEEFAQRLPPHESRNEEDQLNNLNKLGKSKNYSLLKKYAKKIESLSLNFRKSLSSNGCSSNSAKSQKNRKKNNFSQILSKINTKLINLNSSMNQPFRSIWETEAGFVEKMS